jgi:hypothetical protein
MAKLVLTFTNGVGEECPIHRIFCFRYWGEPYDFKKFLKDELDKYLSLQLEYNEVHDKNFRKIQKIDNEIKASVDIKFITGKQKELNAEFVSLGNMIPPWLLDLRTITVYKDEIPSSYDYNKFVRLQDLIYEDLDGILKIRHFGVQGLNEWFEENCVK